MRTLKYALLGQLMLSPKSGYDLMQEFSEESSHTWCASHSQIYPELKRLTNEGLVQFETAIQGRILEKKVYSITAAGREDFTRWMLEDDTLVSLPKDEFRLKLLYLGCVPPAAFLPKITAFREKRRARMNKTKEALDRCDPNPDNGEELGNYLVLLGSYMRDQSYIAWLDLCYEKVRSLQALSPEGAAEDAC